MVYADIKARRKKYNISQTKLSEASGFSKATISSWELEKNYPSDKDIEILNASLSKMIEDIDRGICDIRKKRITHSENKNHFAVPEINSAEDYKERLSLRTNLSDNPYRMELTELYQKAKSHKESDAPKAIALFSGCGGLSLGFAAEGYNLVGHIEIEDSANKIYQDNFPESILLGHDICDVTDNDMYKWLTDYGSIDILIGGPPCQGFSLAGKRDPMDIRNQLYKYYVHIVSILRPRIFVMENVKLLTSMKNADGQLFIDCIIRAFADVGYSIVKQEVNACNYGVPQSRERVILVGVRNDIKKHFIFPEGKYTDDYQGNLLYTPRKIRTFRDATFDLPKLESGEKSTDPLHWSILHPDHVIKWLKNVPEGCSAHENEDPALRPPSGFNTTYKRIRWDEPCSTISTNFNMISGCRNVHPTSTRSLTIREATRAQSFPDEFIFTGKWGNIRKAIGNAVPPLLAASIAKSIYNQFF